MTDNRLESTVIKGFDDNGNRCYPDTVWMGQLDREGYIGLLARKFESGGRKTACFYNLLVTIETRYRKKKN